jgi:hypothetical protein
VRLGIVGDSLNQLTDPIRRTRVVLAQSCPLQPRKPTISLNREEGIGRKPSLSERDQKRIPRYLRAIDRGTRNPQHERQVGKRTAQAVTPARASADRQRETPVMTCMRFICTRVTITRSNAALIYVKAPIAGRGHEKAREMSAIPTNQEGRTGDAGRPAPLRQRE